jgi:G3E family GTPase
LTAAHGASLLRIKGVLDLVGQQRPIVIQGVHHVLYPPAQLPAWPVGEGRSSRLVFITRNLPRSVITAGLP